MESLQMLKEVTSEKTTMVQTC